jgi:hypothetical protein
MIYTWHRTVRLWFCLVAGLFIAIIIFDTNLIQYFDRLHVNSCVICSALLMIFPCLEAYVPYDSEDPLSVLCEITASPNDLYEYLLNNHSKRARLYRWAKRMKKQWNIEEEKLIITIIVVVITSIVIAIWTSCFLHFYIGIK